MPEQVNFPDLIERAGAPFSSVALDRDYAFLAGIVAADIPGAGHSLGDVASETAAIMDVIERMLAQLGMTMSDIVRCDVHLTDVADMPALNAVYEGYFPDGAYPARTCTQSGALFGGSRVEVTCIARRPNTASEQEP